MRINSLFQGIKNLSKNKVLEKNMILLSNIFENGFLSKYVSLFYVDKLPIPEKGLKIKRRFPSFGEEIANIFIDRKKNVLYIAGKNSLYKLDLNSGNITKLFIYAGKWNLYPLKNDFSLWISRDCPSRVYTCSNFKYNIYDLNGHLVKQLSQGGENPKGNCCYRRLFFVCDVDYDNNYLDFITNFSYNGDYRICRLDLTNGNVTTLFSLPNSGQMDTQFGIKIKDIYYTNYAYHVNHFQVFYWNSLTNTTGKIEDQSINPGYNVLYPIGASSTQLFFGNGEGWGTHFNNLFYVDLEAKTYKLLNVYDENGNKIDLSSKIFYARNYAVSKNNTIFALSNIEGSNKILVELEII